MQFRAMALAVYFLLTAFSLSAQAQSTAFSGVVTDANGTVIRGARVSLKRETAPLASTITDDAGRFTLNTTGTEGARLIVTAAGFAQFTEALSTNASRELNVKLSVASLTETIVITAETVDYQAETSTTGSKLDLSRFDNPQSISVIPRQLISDRQVVRLAETADNVAGVRPLPGYGGISSIGYIYRGFRPGFTNGALRNGFREFVPIRLRCISVLPNRFCLRLAADAAARAKRLSQSPDDCLNSASSKACSTIACLRRSRFINSNDRTC